MCYEYTVEVVEQVTTTYKITAPSEEEALKCVMMRGTVVSTLNDVQDKEARLTYDSLIELGYKHFPKANREQIKQILDLSNYTLEQLQEESEAIYHFEYMKELREDNHWQCKCGNEFATCSDPLEQPGVCVECI